MRRDTSGAALVAWGLGALRGADDEVGRLRAYGRRILDGLVEHHMVRDPGDPRCGMVLHSCYNRTANYGTCHEHVWTEFYVARALLDALGRNS